MFFAKRTREQHETIFQLHPTLEDANLITSVLIAHTSIQLQEIC